MVAKYSLCWIYLNLSEGSFPHRDKPDGEEDDKHPPPVPPPVQVSDDPVNLPTLVHHNQQKPLPP